MTFLTSWSLQSPDTTNWVPSISLAGLVTFTPGGGVITATPPVYGDQVDATIWTPAISNAGVVTLTQGTDSGQLRAALLDGSGIQWIASVLGGIVSWLKPLVHIGDLVVFGVVNQESVPLVVKSIQPGADLSALLTLIDAAPGVLLADQGAIPAFESHITLPQIDQAPVPLPLIDHIASDETVMLRSTDGSLVPRILISLHFASGAANPSDSLEVQHRLTGSASAWDRQLFSASATMEVSITTIAEALTYDLRIRSLGLTGQTSDWVTILAYTVIGKTSAPPDVATLALNGTQLVWTYPNAPPDLAGFLIRVNVGDRTSWDDALPLHDGLVSQTTFVLFRDSGVRTYLVKAVDTSQNESLLAKTLLVDYGALATENIAEFLDFKVLGFPGVITRGSVIGGNLVANSATLFWGDDAQPFWTFDAALFMTSTYDAMTYEFTVTPPTDWLAGTLLIDALVLADTWTLEYAADASAYWWGDASSLWWETDATLEWSALPVTFLSWPGSLSGYTRQSYRFRLTTSAGNVQGIVEQLQAIFDMPDVEEVLVDAVVALPGFDSNGNSLPMRLVLTKAFAAILVVAPTVVEDGSGAVRVRVLDKDPSGPAVMAVNTNGVPVAGHADFVIKGY